MTRYTVSKEADRDSRDDASPSSEPWILELSVHRLARIVHRINDRSRVCVFGLFAKFLRLTRKKKRTRKRWENRWEQSGNSFGRVTKGGITR